LHTAFKTDKYRLKKKRNLHQIGFMDNGFIFCTQKSLDTNELIEVFEEDYGDDFDKDFYEVDLPEEDEGKPCYFCGKPMTEKEEEYGHVCDECGVLGFDF
ncbi:hypothetical protein GOV10_05220, partial [Candidatus Woesearchaeota archaeon]|nr:hypothetical protein [Candidatus Woesearchaeota archaeon]